MTWREPTVIGISLSDPSRLTVNLIEKLEIRALFTFYHSRYGHLRFECQHSTDNVVNVNTAATQPTATPADGSAEVQAAAPELLVAVLYKQHDAKKSPFFQKKDRALVDEFFTKPLADLIWKDSNGPEGELGAIDFDQLYDGQDFEIKNLAVDKGEIKGDIASVVANFTNFGEKRAVFFAMKQAGSDWKIEDIKSGRQGSLLKIMKDHFAAVPAKDTAVKGEFEGKYQVGDTTCIVNNVEMSFQVKWAK